MCGTHSHNSLSAWMSIAASTCRSPTSVLCQCLNYLSAVSRPILSNLMPLAVWQANESQLPFGLDVNCYRASALHGQAASMVSTTFRRCEENQQPSSLSVGANIKEPRATAFRHQSHGKLYHICGCAYKDAQPHWSVLRQNAVSHP